MHLICEASEDIIPEEELFEEQEDSDETLATFGLLLQDEETRAPFGPLREAHSARSTIPLRKFAKNQTILAMSQVCRTWKSQLTHSKYLWRDIAFDVTEPKSVLLAKDFLDLVKDSTIPLHIYAAFGRSADPEVSGLLQNLRTHIDRWETFEYHGELKEYRQYFHLGAQRLCHFSDHHDFSSSLLPPQNIFAGKTPALRSLSTSQIGNWSPSTLANVTELNISFCQQSARFSFRSLIELFRSTPNLEVLRLASPKPPLLDCAAEQSVDLPRLEILRLYNPNIYPLVAHLRLPCVRGMVFSSSYDRWSRVLSHQVFESRNIFSSFPPITLLEQEFSSVEIQICSLPNGSLRFSIHLSNDDKYFFWIHLNLLGEGWCRWNDYFKRSITELAERVRLGAGAHLQLLSDFPLDCNPFLGFNAVKFLTFDGHARDILQMLICVSHGTPPPTLFPRLEVLILMDDQMNDGEISLIPACLGLRENLTIIVSGANDPLLQAIGDYCVIEGEHIFPNSCPRSILIHSCS